MWLDLAQFQRQYWYFRGAERHICSETIKSRNWDFIELFFISKWKRGWMNFLFSRLRFQTIGHLRQAKSHDAFRMSSTCRKHYGENFIQPKQSFSVMRTSFFKWWQSLVCVGQAAVTISYCPSLNRPKRENTENVLSLPPCFWLIIPAGHQVQWGQRGCRAAPVPPGSPSITSEEPPLSKTLTGAKETDGGDEKEGVVKNSQPWLYFAL